MAIKKSLLERKWYYRVARVIVWVVPVIVIAVLVFKNGINFSEITKLNLVKILQDNVNAIVYAVIGLLAYILLIKIVWRATLYIVFGGLENDMAGANVGAKQSQVVGSSGQISQRASLSNEDRKQIGFYLGLLVIIAIIYYAYFIWKPVGVNNNNNNNGGGSSCVATGCDSSWYCAGTYYDNGVQKRVNGCVSQKPGDTYPSWSGNCRKCP